MKITSPIKGYTGTAEIGPYTLDFTDGVAEVEGLNAGAKKWLKANGYGVGESPRSKPPAAPEPLDPRKGAADERIGTPIRDGAVDPEPGDFLGPTNAGDANPHGSKAVNPEIHASEGVRPVKGGVVHVGDPDAQDAAEKAHTEAATDGTPVTLTEAEEDNRPEPVPANPHPSPDGDGEEAEPVELKGKALDEALEAAGLPKSGTADEKRARLANHDTEA